MSSKHYGLKGPCIYTFFFNFAEKLSKYRLQLSIVGWTQPPHFTSFVKNSFVSAEGGVQ
jgi:hypothetical protein